MAHAPFSTQNAGDVCPKLFRLVPSQRGGPLVTWLSSSSIKKNLPRTKAEDETKQRNEWIDNGMNLNMISVTDCLSEGVYSVQSTVFTEQQRRRRENEQEKENEEEEGGGEGGDELERKY